MVQWRPWKWTTASSELVLINTLKALPHNPTKKDTLVRTGTTPMTKKITNTYLKVTKLGIRDFPTALKPCSWYTTKQLTYGHIS